MLDPPADAQSALQRGADCANQKYARRQFLLGSGLAGAADAERGKEVYKTCAACHTEKPDALGPDSTTARISTISSNILQRFDRRISSWTAHLLAARIPQV
jgi:mono/diheme cytochrome c family protein